MRIIIKVRRDEVWEGLYLPFYLLFKNNKWRWEAVSASLTLSGGILCPIVGGILNLLVSYTRLGYERLVLYKGSMFLYLMTVPLLMLGAHFLDVMEKKTLELALGK